MAEPADRHRDEAAWIGRVVTGDDHQAFGELVRLHQSAVRLFLRRLTGGDESRADDLAQETFWRAYRHIATYQGRGRFLSWLFGIAYQEFVTAQRRDRRALEVGLPPDLAASGDAGRAFADQRTFDQLLATLRAEERAVLELHYRHELSHPEVATALNLPLGTVKTLIRRARLKLQGQAAPDLREDDA